MMVTSRNGMKNTALRIVVRLLFLFVIPTAIIGCSQAPSQPAGSATATEKTLAASQPQAASTVLETTTPAANATSSSGGGAPSSISTSVADRTPVPTPTPGPIDREIGNFVTSLGLTGQTFFGLSVEDWINLAISVLMILVGYLAANWLIITLLMRLTKRSSNELDNLFLSAIESPMRWLILVFITRFALLRLEFINEGTRTALEDAFFIIALFLATIIGTRLIQSAASWYIGTKKSEANSERYIPLVTIIQRVGYFFLLIIAISIGLDHFGVNITVLAAVLLLVGGVITFGAQETVQNIVSGFLILIDQPFRVGDDIMIQDLDTWGKVLEIGTHTTRLRTRDNREVIIPNIKIGGSMVTNYSLPDPSFRVETNIGVAYGSDFDQVRKVITEAVRSVDGVLADKSVSIYFSEFGDSSRSMKVRWWVASRADKNPSLDRVNQALELALTKAGIVLPNNVMDLNVNLRGTAAASPATTKEKSA
jgi:small-conductance mechanosensitive channel